MSADYTIVIATRNRADALALSLPLHLKQSRLPKAIIVVDSSGDPTPNQTLVKRLAAATSVPLDHIRSEAGASLQRNIGLARVATDVVFFPDDDSLVHPGALEAMMRIYDRDTDHIIGGVCSAEARTPPPGFLDRTSYEMQTSDRVKARIAQRRYALEARLFPDPFHEIARVFYTKLPAPPAWLGQENALTVPLMTGFRMSFRTELIRKAGFNESLGRYALAEDIDAGFSILKTHLLIGARNAQIYHHKAPDRRTNGRAMGVMQVLNRAYVIARSDIWQNSPSDRPAIRRSLRRFTAYKLMQYAAAGHSRFGRDRLRGAWDAARVVPGLLAASAQECDQRYLMLRAGLFQAED